MCVSCHSPAPRVVCEHPFKDIAVTDVNWISQSDIDWLNHFKLPTGWIWPNYIQLNFDRNFPWSGSTIYPGDKCSVVSSEEKGGTGSTWPWSTGVPVTIWIQSNKHDPTWRTKSTMMDARVRWKDPIHFQLFYLMSVVSITFPMKECGWADRWHSIFSTFINVCETLK